MKLFNYTKVPDVVLREMVRFCNIELNARGFDISFKNSWALTGNVRIWAATQKNNHAQVGAD